MKTDIIKGHMDTWLKLHELRLPIKRAWAVTKKKLLGHPPNQRWRHVHGPLAATIATLLDEGGSLRSLDDGLMGRALHGASPLLP